MIVQPGETISSLAKKYGVSEDDIFRANPQIGTEPWEGMDIKIPGQSGNLNQTLSSTNKTLPPSTPGNHLNLFANVLGQAVNRAAALSNQQGMNIVKNRTQGLNMPGSSLSQIMDMVNKQATSGFQNVYESTLAFMKDKYQQSRDLLNQIISEKALPQFTDNQIKDFAQQNGYNANYLLALKQRQTEEMAGKTISKRANREADINNFLVSNLGKDNFISADTYSKAYHQWYSEGGSLSDFQKLFPVDTWLRPQEQTKLPSSLRPTPSSLKELPADAQNQIAILQDLIYKYNTDDNYNVTSTDPLTGKPVLITPDYIKSAFPEWVRYLNFEKGK